MRSPINPWKMSGYKAGQNVICRISYPEPGGYAVIVSKDNDNLPGFLPTQEELKIGEEILAQFVCVSNHRILLSERFSSTNKTRNAYQSVRWEDQLDELEDILAAAANPNVVSQGQNQTDFEEDAAFHVWAKIQERKLHSRRAIDLILPPVSVACLQSFKIAEYDANWLITHLEGGMRTCSVKVTSEEVFSRSAILLYRGRSVGCIYSCKQMPESPSTVEALGMVLDDLELPGTSVSIFDLPESLTLTMAALFLGYPVPHSVNMPEADKYLDYISGELGKKGQTACLAIRLPATGAHCFAYFYRGQFVGAFDVEEQIFSKEADFISQILQKDKNATIDVSILPPEMTSSAVRFGYSLSMAKSHHAKRNQAT
jgi:hypothetical protein